MRKYIVKDREFKIIPRSIKGATLCCVTDTQEDYFEVKLKTDETYCKNETVELFSITPQGLLYFESCVSDVVENDIKVLYPFSHKFLQRREYTRIDFSKNILINEKDSDSTIKATILDISAGGMKISSCSELSLSKDYKIYVEIDRSIKIDCLFQPIRIEADSINGYTVSGRFKILKNIDRISLVQFCFKKQMENQNK